EQGADTGRRCTPGSRTRALNREDPLHHTAGRHQGGCWNRGKGTRGISLDEAHRAISKGVKPCDVRPDSALEFLET
ncbi:DUF6233 domain-containing protein, partial [Streptomyces sp. ME02-6979A]